MPKVTKAGSPGAILSGLKPSFSSSGQNLFDSIKSEPFSIPEDDGSDLTHTFFNPDREGWLLKLGETSLHIL